jgi:hypothetical protein
MIALGCNLRLAGALRNVRSGPRPAAQQYFSNGLFDSIQSVA